MDIQEIIQQVWPDWEIRDTIGSGAFSTVYRASRRERIAGEKDSAIKVIRIPHDDSDWDRMLAEGKTPEQTEAYFQGFVDDSLREIQAMDALSGHTNIVNIFDYRRVRDGNVWYILIRMELLQKVDAGNLTEEEAVRLGMDVCTALSICRKKNIVHRDVSLDNVFVHDGSYKLGDFGVAKVLEGTVMQSIAGKPLYMAPEIYNATLVENDMDSAARVDIYSLGILLYRLTHHMNYPFEDPDTPNVSASERSSAFRRRVIEGEALPPPKYASPALAEIILKATMADPRKRYVSADDMRKDLQALSAPKEPERKPAKLPRLSRKKKGIIAAAVLALIMIAAGIWFLTRPEVPPPPPPAEPEPEMIRVTLTAPDTMNVPTFDATLKILKDRLDRFTDGVGDYKIQTFVDRIELLLPKAAFPNEDFDRVLSGFLVRPTELYAVNANGQYVKIERSDLQVAIREGSIENVNPTDYGIETDVYPYLEIVLSDAVSSDIREKLGQDFTFKMDYEKYRNPPGTIYTFNTIPAGDGKTFFIVMNDPDGRFCRLVQYNLTNDPMPDTLDYAIDLNNLAVWQDSGFGQNQCAFEDLQGQTVTFRISAYQPSEGNEIDLLHTLKARLDALGTPYALGIYRTDDYTYYMVAISTSRIGIPIMYALANEDIYIKTGLSELRLNLENLALLPGTDSFILTPDPENSMYDLYSARLSTMAGEDIKVFFEYGQYSLFAGRILEDGAIEITSLCSVQDSIPVSRPLTKDDAWLVDFMRALVQNPKYPAVSMRFSNEYQINTDFGQPVPSDPGFAVVFDPGAAAIQQKLRTVWRNTTVTASASVIHIMLNLPVDEYFAANSVKLMEEMYGLLDFPSMCQTHLYFDLNPKTDSDPISILFKKKEKNLFYSEEDSSYIEEGYIYAKIDSPRRENEPYYQELVDAINSSEFCKSFFREITSPQPVEPEPEMIRVTLTAPDTMNVPTFDATLKTLTDRLDIFFTDDFGGYKIQTLADRIDLLLPRAAFPKENFDLVLSGFLVRPTELYAVDTNYDHYVKIERSDLKQVAIREGTLENVNPADYGIESDVYSYIEIVLSDDISNDIREQLGQDFTFILDYEKYRNSSKTPYSFNAVPAGDGKTFFILVNDPDGRSYRIIQHNLTNDPMPDALDYAIDMNDLAVWQDSDFGQNQCAFEDLQGQTVTFRFRAYQPTEGNEIDLLHTLRARLDALGTPYAIGIYRTENYTYYMIAISISRMGIPIMNALTNDSIYIKTGLSKLQISLNSMILQPGTNSFTLTLDPKYSLYDKYSARLSSLAGKDVNVYVRYGLIPLFSGRVLENGAIEITGVCTVQDSIPVARSLTDDDAWLVDFMQALVQNPKYSSTSLYFLDEYQINSDFGQLVPSDPGFAIGFDAGNEAIQQKLQTVWRDATVTASSSQLRVMLNLPVDEYFAAKSVKLVEEIYGLLDFASMYQDELYFDLDPETDSNPISIIFSKKEKDLYYEEGDSSYIEEGYTYISVHSPNKPNETQSQELLDAINGSEFCKPFFHDESSWYYGFVTK